MIMRMKRFARAAPRTAYLSTSNHNCRIHSNDGSYRGHTPGTNSARSLGGTTAVMAIVATSLNISGKTRLLQKKEIAAKYVSWAVMFL